MSALAKARRSGQLTLNGRNKRFYEDFFLRVVGKRGLRRPVVANGHSLRWDGYPGHKPYQVVFSNDVSAPTSRESPEMRTLLLPEEDPFRQLTAGNVKRWLLGHPLHPYIIDPQAKVERIDEGEPELLHRQVQLDASEVGRTYLNRFHETGDLHYQRFLYVAPTGTGKSEVYLDLLSERLQQVANEPSLIVVSSERANVVRDRYLEANLKKKGTDFEIVHWGGQGEKNAGITDLNSLVQKVKDANKPIVLVTTNDSLLQAVAEGKGQASNCSQLKEVLRGLIVDEAHHLGGSEISSLFGKLLDGNTKASLSGFTATPISNNRSIQKLFNYHGFWAYIDDAKSYLKNPQPIDRDTADIAKQLRIAFNEGELVGFEEIHYVPLKEEGSDGTVYIKRDPLNEYSTDIIDPAYYSRLLARLKPILTTGKGLVIANDVTEARDLTRIINEVLEVPAELITHDNAPAGSKTERAVLRRFNQGETNVLVSVMKLDEGINIHDANFYIDLNRDPSARQFLQRVGRTTRVSPGKTETQIYLLSEFTEEQLRRKIQQTFGMGTVRDGTGTAKRALPNSFKQGTVDIDVSLFLKELEVNNINRINFWDTYRYSLPATELHIFQNEIAHNTAKLFPGWSERASDYFKHLERELPPQKRESYLQELNDLNLSQTAFRHARTKMGSADSLHQAFAIFVKHKGEPTEKRITVEQLKRWGLTTGEKYSLKESDLHSFQQDIVSRSSALFPGWVTKTNDYFKTLANSLPRNVRAAYLKELRALKLSQTAFDAARTKLRSADTLHQAFALFANYKGEPTERRITLEQMKKWGLTTGERHSVLEKELRTFQRNIVSKSAALFPGWVTRTNDYFKSLASELSEKNRSAYLKELEELKISQTAFRSAHTVLGSADSLHQAFALFAKHKGDPVEGPLTLKKLDQLGLATGMRYSVKESALRSFQQEIVRNAAVLFPGWTKKTKDYFKNLADKLPENERSSYLKELATLNLSQTAFNRARSQLGSAHSIHQAFALFAKHKGYTIQKQTTVRDLQQLGLLGE